MVKVVMVLQLQFQQVQSLMPAAAVLVVQVILNQVQEQVVQVVEEQVVVLVQQELMEGVTQAVEAVEDMLFLRQQVEQVDRV
jgi:hypothetical protein